jgi:hypothetical protein
MKKNNVVFTGSGPDARDFFLDQAAGVKAPNPITAEEILAANGENKNEVTGGSIQGTTLGAQRGNKNALTHGVYSEDLVLPWESEEDLRKLYEALKEEYQPEGCSEEHALLSIAKFMWLQRRANNMALLQFQAGMPEACHDTPWRAILHYQRETPQRVEELTQGAESMIKEITETITNFRTRSNSAPTNTAQGKQTQSEFAQLAAEVGRIDDCVQKKIMPAIKNLVSQVEQQTSLFSKAYDPDQIERQVAIDAAMETRVEKALWRFTAIKEFKKIRAPSVIPSQRPPRRAQIPKKGKLPPKLTFK